MKENKEESGTLDVMSGRLSVITKSQFNIKKNRVLIWNDKINCICLSKTINTGSLLCLQSEDCKQYY